MMAVIRPSACRTTGSSSTLSSCSLKESHSACAGPAPREMTGGQDLITRFHGRLAGPPDL
jgi:hypothetical protein